MRKLSRLAFLGIAFLCTGFLYAQQTFPENGVIDPRHGHFAFTNATIVKDATTTLKNATLIIKDGKIVAVGNDLKVPPGAVEINCTDKYIYPSFIDIYADYGTTIPQRPAGGSNFAQQPQLTTNTKGLMAGTRLLKVKRMLIKFLLWMMQKPKVCVKLVSEQCFRMYEMALPVVQEHWFHWQMKKRTRLF